LPTEEEKAKGANSDISLRNTQGVTTISTPSKETEEGEDNLLCNLREVQCLICCLLHQMYIADPNIAKLVHFQVCAQKNVFGFVLEGSMYSINTSHVKMRKDHGLLQYLEKSKFSVLIKYSNTLSLF
jgi:hypothetical protein